MNTASEKPPADPCPIVVETFDTNGKLEKSKIIDHGDFHDRKWLAKHCWWAMRNGRTVTTYPAKMG